MTLNGLAKQILTVKGMAGVGFSLFVAGWIGRGMLTADDGMLWPAEARRMIGAQDKVNGEQTRTLTDHDLRITENTRQITTLLEMRTTVDAILRIVCREDVREVECRRVYQ